MSLAAPGARAGTQQPALTLGEVLAAAPASPPRISPHHWKVINALRFCRTPQLGGHRYHCEHCGRDHFVPRSCGNRHCPNCQGRQALEWLERQQTLLLPAPYFHVVFTLPHQLNPLIQQNQRVLYNTLFRSAAQTLLDFGRNNLGAQLGLTLVLHTWSQTLLDHYHVHCIVSGGGLALDGSGWKSTGTKFLFPVMALSKVFQGKFCEELQEHFAAGRLQFHGQLSPLGQTPAFQALVRQATAKSWNVYAKRPFAGPEQVLKYLSRYTHRVAIGNRRLIRLDRQEQSVAFSYKVRRENGPPIWRVMSLRLEEFWRRFCLHILPERFVKIRHYGMLANRGRQQRIDQAKALLLPGRGEAPPPAEPEETLSIQSPSTEPKPPRWTCPYCGERALVLVEAVAAQARPPPESDDAAP